MSAAGTGASSAAPVSTNRKPPTLDANGLVTNISLNPCTKWIFTEWLRFSEKEYEEFRTDSIRGIETHISKEGKQLSKARLEPLIKTVINDGLLLKWQPRFARCSATNVIESQIRSYVISLNGKVNDMSRRNHNDPTVIFDNPVPYPQTASLARLTQQNTSRPPQQAPGLLQQLAVRRRDTSPDDSNASLVIRTRVRKAAPRWRTFHVRFSFPSVSSAAALEFRLLEVVDVRLSHVFEFGLEHVNCMHVEIDNLRRGIVDFASQIYPEMDGNFDGWLLARNSLDQQSVLYHSYQLRTAYETWLSEIVEGTRDENIWPLVFVPPDWQWRAVSRK